MFPIEGYVNAYIHTINTKKGPTRTRRHTARDTEGAIDRLCRTVARVLNIGHEGSYAPSRSLPAT